MMIFIFPTNHSLKHVFFCFEASQVTHAVENNCCHLVVVYEDCNTMAGDYLWHHTDDACAQVHCIRNEARRARRNVRASAQRQLPNKAQRWGRHSYSQPVRAISRCRQACWHEDQQWHGDRRYRGNGAVSNSPGTRRLPGALWLPVSAAWHQCKWQCV